MNEAIKLAHEHGYGVEVSVFSSGDMERACLFDPLFWQALGKTIHGYTVIRNGFGESVGVTVSEEWRRDWHRFIDHIADGKDIDQFFKELIANQ